MTAGRVGARRRLGGGAAGSASRWWRCAVALLVLAHAPGCQSIEILSAQQGGALVHNTKVGMSREEVVSQLGEPHKREVIQNTEFLFYNTNWAMAQSAEQRSPIAIAQNKVVGLGKPYYEAFVKSQLSSPWTGDVSREQPERQSAARP